MPAALPCCTVDPAKTPSAGDIFTGSELGRALTEQYGNVQVRYLRRGNQWYSLPLLYDVDVLITLLDAYDLSRLLPMSQSSDLPYDTSHSGSRPPDLRLKPTLVTVAWARNWFNRWLSRPWFGSYHLVLASSSLSKGFLEAVKDAVGFPVQCAVHCPRSSEGGSVFSRRSSPPVRVFPIATSMLDTPPVHASAQPKRMVHRGV
ncbi:hypothetical protein EON64_20715, partial [archaeon]